MRTMSRCANSLFEDTNNVRLSRYHTRPSGEVFTNKNKSSEYLIIILNFISDKILALI